MKPEDYDTLAQLVAELVDEGLSDQRRDQLAQILENDSQAREYYLRCVQVHARLELLHVPADDCSETAIGDAAPPTNAPANISPRTKSWLDRASRHPTWPSIAVTVVAMVAMVAVMDVMSVKDRVAKSGDKKSKGEQREPIAEPDFVAKLSDWKNAVWLEGTRPPKRYPELKIGKRLVIESGFIEVTYLTGARVVIEGPAEFVVGGEPVGNAVPGVPERHRGRSLQDDLANSGYLALGKLVARVEGEEAKGFTIDTPNASVEDFGTEFGVAVQRDGAADVLVISGEVDVVRDATENRPGERIRLAKDQGVFVVAQGGAISRRRKVDVRRFAVLTRRMRASITANRPPDVAVLPNPGLGPAGKYHVIFVTSTAISAVDATGVIAPYNAHVQGVADAAGVGNTAGITWKAVGSTALIDAKDNIGYSGSSLPLYLMDGTPSGKLLATNSADFFDNNIPAGGISHDELGNNVGTLDVATGTLADGTAHGSAYLGNGGNVAGGRTGSTTNYLTIGFSNSNQMYAFSEVLVEGAPIAAASTPETGTVVSEIQVPGSDDEVKAE